MPERLAVELGSVSVHLLAAQPGFDREARFELARLAFGVGLL